MDKNFLKIIVYEIYSAICIFFPPLILFFPVIAFDFLSSKNQPIILSILVPIIYNISFYSTYQYILVLLIFIAASALKIWTSKMSEMRRNLNKQRDDMTEKSLVMQEKIDELTSSQDNECKLATLNERNRIAREIHDNVGHLLSSSILQIGAIMAITKDQQIKESLSVVKQTLDDGMNSIRNSVHNLNNESIDLPRNIKKLVDEFTFCNISLEYKYSTDPPTNVKYAIIAIVKEALSNVIKHSNASCVEIKLYEHPSLFQLVIKDNGTSFKTNPNGMGLENIRQRVENLKGIVNFETSDGFKIFISFTKQFLED